MTIARSTRLVAERLLLPRTVALLGGETALGRQLAFNLHQGAFDGQIWQVGPGGLAALPASPDLALIASPPAQVPADLAALAARGGQAAIVVSATPDLGVAARAAGVRVLGPHSFGLAVPRLGLNASLAHMAVPQGGVALITQSASLARVVVDWAGPNGVGFSHVVGVGGNGDVGFGLVLDLISRDPHTKLILLDIRRLRDRRAFISAARAASRLRPVVALRPGGRLLDESGRADAVFAAALNRAGVFVVHRLEAFLAAAETLSRARPLRGETACIVTNAIGPGRLAADAAIAAGITLATLPPEARTSLTASLPAELIHGLVYTGNAPSDGTDAGTAVPINVANIAAMVSALPTLGGVLAVLAPTGPADAAAIGALIAAAQVARLPVLSCVMGESTGAAHRARLAEAGLPVFATPEQAVEAFTHLLRDRHARQAARELPTSQVLALAPDHARIAQLLQAAHAAQRLVLSNSEAAAMLGAYGLNTEPAPPDAPLASIMVHDDPVFGPAIGLRAPPDGPTCYDLPPLNLKLARDLATRAGLTDPKLIEAAADALVRVSQALAELPQIASLTIARLALTSDGPRAGGLALHLRPPGDLAMLAISPYPEHLSEIWRTGGADFLIRPIRPEDAQAHAAFIARVPPDDLRYRFFTALREVAPEQMARLTQIDYDREMAFIAVRQSDQATVGVARLVREADAGRGEFAILVQPDMKGKGLATHLMDRLIQWARFAGIPSINGQVLADNHPMLAFVRRLGFSVHALPEESDVVEAVLEVE